MFSPEMLEKYRSMTPEEVIEALNMVLDCEITPIDMVVAFYTILKPDRAAALGAALKGALTRHCPSDHA